jgi:1-acyl-sn-glycerol-3-phosphate acyltransferase
VPGAPTPVAASAGQAPGGAQEPDPVRGRTRPSGAHRGATGTGADDAGEGDAPSKPGHRPGAVRAGRTGRTRLTRVAADPETPVEPPAASAARPSVPRRADDGLDRGVTGTPMADPAGLERALAGMLAFLRRRITGDYEVDELGFDADLTEHVVAPLLRPAYRSYFRVETRGLENVPDTGGALVVANHSGTLPIDALMVAMALLDHHPAHRYLRMLAADLVFSVPFLAPLARKTGNTLACQADAERLLDKGELVGVWPEGFKGVGKAFSERYKLQRFGRGGFVSAALRAGVPIIPCTIVGAEEIYPMLGNARTVARLLGLPYFPLTPTFPWLGPLGAVPLPSKWLIEFGEPVPTDHLTPAAAEDPMLVFELTDRIRETIQHTLYGLLMQRRSVFF